MTQIQDLVDSLADRLRSPVGIDDRRYRAVAYSSHPDSIDPVRRMSILGRQAPSAVTEWLDDLGLQTATEDVRLPRNEALGMAPRVCVPLRFHDRLLGFLWLMDEQGLTDETLHEVDDYAAQMCHELLRLEQEEAGTRLREAEAVRALTTGTAGERDLAPGTVASACCYVVVLVRPLGEGLPLGREADVRLTLATDRTRRGAAPRHVLAAVGDSRAVVVCAGPSFEQLARCASGLLTSAETEFSDLDDVVVSVGVSGSRHRLSELGSARREAELAARVAAAPTGIGPLALWTGLGAYRMAAALVDDRDPVDYLPVTLRTLLRAGDAHVLVPTIETFLERGGDVAVASAELFIHRSSLYNRLHRAEELSGVDLRSGSDRLELQLGLRLWRLAGAPELTGRIDASS
jgi:DNA-binding PucR family transcriptional regulator